MDNHFKVRASLEYIEKNLNDKINLDKLAQKSYLSKYHYHRLFHKMTGESVARYITRRRSFLTSGIGEERQMLCPEKQRSTDSPAVNIRRAAGAGHGY